MFFSPGHRTSGSFPICIQPMVVLSQRKGHICLLFYTATKLSDIRNDCSSSSRGNLNSFDSRHLLSWARTKTSGDRGLKQHLLSVQGLRLTARGQ